MKNFSYNENIDSLDVSDLYVADGLKHAQKKGLKRIRILKDPLSSGTVLDLSSLAGNATIESLNISQDINLKKVDFSPLYKCSSLEELMTPYTRNAIEFKKLPRLRTLYLSSATDEIADLHLAHVTDLLIVGARNKNLDFLAAPNLRLLRLSGGSLESLQGLEKCQSLRELGISHCSKMSSIEVLRDLGLVKLSVEKCKLLRDYSVLSDHPSMEELFVSELDSLAFVTSMRKIERIKFWSVSDGDLSPLLASSTLKAVDFYPQKKHYTHTNDQINSLLRSVAPRHLPS